MRRLDVLQFMFENGFDIQMPCIRDVLHVLIEQVSSTKDTDTIQPVIRFLVDHGVDVNWQVRRIMVALLDFFLSLHDSVQATYTQHYTLHARKICME